MHWVSARLLRCSKILVNIQHTTLAGGSFQWMSVCSVAKSTSVVEKIFVLRHLLLFANALLVVIVFFRCYFLRNNSVCTNVLHRDKNGAEPGSLTLSLRQAHLCEKLDFLQLILSPGKYLGLGVTGTQHHVSGL